MKIILIFLCLMLLLLAGGSASLAKYEFIPRLSVSETYTDNLMLADERLEEDWITTFVPGVDYSLEMKKLTLDFNYSLYFKNYRNHPKEDEKNLRDVQRAQLEAWLLPERPFSLMLREEISRVVIDDRGRSVEENELVNKTTLYRFTLLPEYRWRISSRFNAIFGYRYDNYNYVSDAGTDTETQRFSLRLENQLLRSTQLNLTVFHEEYQFENSEEIPLQLVSGGVEHHLGADWLLSAEGGYARINFVNRKDTEEGIWIVKLVGEVGRNLQLSLLSDQAFVITVDSGLTRRTQAQAALKLQRRVVIELKSYWMEDLFLSEERTDRSVGVELKSIFPLAKKLQLMLKADYARFEYLPGDEDGQRTGFGTAVEFLTRYGGFELKYTYRISDSNLNFNDYENHIATISASLRL